MREINSSFGDYTKRGEESEKWKEQGKQRTVDLIILEPAVIQKTRVSQKYRRAHRLKEIRVWELGNLDFLGSIRS